MLRHKDILTGIGGIGLALIQGCGGAPTPEATLVPVPTATPTPEWAYKPIDFEQECLRRIVGREPNPVEEQFGTIKDGVNVLKRLWNVREEDIGKDVSDIAQAVSQAYFNLS